MSEAYTTQVLDHLGIVAGICQQIDLIATNELDLEKLPTQELLTIYRDQNLSVERGFRFLKDSLFFASRFFLKKPSRIMALLMIMGLSLLIYALAEHELREQLKGQDQFIPNQKGKSTQHPTMRRVFQMFEGIHIPLIESGEMRKRMVLNVQEVHRQIAGLLGEPILHLCFGVVTCGISVSGKE
jgi:transposase